MSAKRCLILLTLILGLLGASVAPDGERNRRILEEWRQDPEHEARLERDLEAFYALPGTRQAAIRRLDQELHKADPATQRRLWGVLKRYVRWLHTLSPEQRQVLVNSQPAERLVLIRQIREQQFLDRLPQRLREELTALPKDQLGQRLVTLHKEEDQRRQQLQRLARQPVPAPSPRTPANLKDLPLEVAAYVQDQLLPRLSPQERQRLDAAQGKPVVFLATLAELARAHPVLPPLPSGRVTRYRDLPWGARVLLSRERLERSGQWQLLWAKMGRWPEFALAFVELVPAPQRRSLPPLGASQPADFPASTRAAIENLIKKLSPQEARRLQDAQRHWPEYPLLLHELAHKKHVALPGLTPPGPREWWESGPQR